MNYFTHCIISCCRRINQSIFNQSIHFTILGLWFSFILVYSANILEPLLGPMWTINQKSTLFLVSSSNWNCLTESNPEPKIRFSALYIHLYTPPHLRNINKIIVILLVNIVKFKPNYFFQKFKCFSLYQLRSPIYRTFGSLVSFIKKISYYY